MLPSVARPAPVSIMIPLIWCAICPLASMTVFAGAALGSESAGLVPTALLRMPGTALLAWALVLDCRLVF